LQEIFNNSNVGVKIDLVYSGANFSFQSITVQEKTRHFSEKIKGMNDIEGKVNKINDSDTDAMKRKFRSCSSKYNRLKVMREISCLLEVEVLADSKDL
jgi:hypothetical protein